MLSRTADHLFWMARYMERAENTARMLDVNYQMSLLPQSDAAAERGWRGLLSISELSGDFAKRYGEVTPQQRHRLHGERRRERLVDPSAACWPRARTRAPCAARSPPRSGRRRTRPGSSSSAWSPTTRSSASPAEAFEWVKFRSHLSRGVTVGTMLQDEAFHFLRIGSFLERADNTARLLDVKFHAVESDSSARPRRARHSRRQAEPSQSQSSQSTPESEPGPGQRQGRRVRLLSLVGVLRSVSASRSIARSIAT